jgi:hypothetical protein
MAISEKSKTEVTMNVEKAETAPAKKKTFWQGFLNFLMMGGFLVILIIGVAIAIGISLLVGK